MKNNCINYLFLILIFISSHLSLSAQCNRMADSLELVKLYNATGGPNWTNKWDLTKPIETWYGVKIMQNCIKALNLSNNNLISTGSIYTFRLQSPDTLILKNNRITSQLPLEINPNIKLLDLSNNDFRLCIPDSYKILCNTNATVDLSFNFELPWDGSFNQFCFSSTQIGAPCRNGGACSFIQNNCSCSRVNFRISISDSLELVKFNKALDGDNWKVKWDFTKPVPEWHGFKNSIQFSNCDRFDLNLSDNQLKGEIPSLNIPGLKSLNISNNKIFGMFPSLSGLPNLTTLNIVGNSFSGPVPDPQAPALGGLDLSGNLFTGAPPNFSGLPSATSIDISDNPISGQLPDFNKLKSCTNLKITNTNISGKVPNFKDFPGGASIDLSHNQNSAWYNNSTFDSIRNLDLSYNQIKGTVPKTSFKKLRSIFLQGNCIENFDIRSADIPLNPRIDLSENKLTCEDIKFSTSSLVYIIKNQAKVFKDKKYYFKVGQYGEIQTDTDTLLTNNRYTWFKNGNQIALSPPNNTSNRKFVWNNIKLTDAGRYSFMYFNASISSKLTLESYPINVKVCDIKSDSSELVRLYNSLGGSMWKNKTNWLELGKAIKNWYGIRIDSLGCIQSINLNNNNLVGVLPALNINTLDSLNLSENKISGEIPELKIPFIKYINLRSNQLTGDFPDTRVEWMDLAGLDLGNNNLVGPIPPDLGDICELHELKLDRNKIIGNLPEELTRLQKLEIGKVDFSNNLIDTLKPKIVYFCKFGDEVLESNPSFGKFQSICNQTCNNLGWNYLANQKWFQDSLKNQQCSCKVTSGLSTIKQNEFAFISKKCFDAELKTFYQHFDFYDCAGKLVDTIYATNTRIFASFGSVPLDTFKNIPFYTYWKCGDTLQRNAVDLSEIIPKKEFFDSNNDDSIICYPNPVDNILRCDVLEKLKTISISDIQGRKINLHKFLQRDHQIEIDFSGVQSGIYLLEMWTDSGRSYRKVIKGE